MWAMCIIAANGLAQTYTFRNVAGNTNSGSTDGANSSAQFNFPSGLAADSLGNLFISDQLNYTIRKVTPVGTNWVVSTIAGTPGQFNFNKVQDGTNAHALFNFPTGIALDPFGSLFVADQQNNTIRKITPISGTTNWVVTTIAGQGPNNPGDADGTNSTARFSGPTGIAVDANSNVFVADQYNNTIRKISPLAGTPNWVTTTIAGGGGTNDYGDVDGTNSAARFNAPSGVAVGANGILFVADQYNNDIRKITPSGTNWIVTTIAGKGPLRPGSTDGTNLTARFYYPTGLAMDASGNLFVADQNNNTIRKLTLLGTNWVTTTIGGQPPPQNPGTNNASGTNALFYQPFGLAVDAKGSVFVADTFNNTIRIGYLPPVILDPPPPFSLYQGAFAFNLTGPTAQLVLIQASSDLLTWFPIWTNAFGPGPLSFTDPQPANSPALFYRAYLP